jgi:hypothetical protein
MAFWKIYFNFLVTFREKTVNKRGVRTTKSYKKPLIIFFNKKTLLKGYDNMRQKNIEAL